MPALPAGSAAAKGSAGTLIDQTLREVFGHARLRDARRGDRAGDQGPVHPRSDAHGRWQVPLLPTARGFVQRSHGRRIASYRVDERPMRPAARVGHSRHPGQQFVERGRIGASQEDIVGGTARIALTTPERLSEPNFLRLLGTRPVALVVVDGAHCISQSGHDFRPAFLEIGTAIRALGSPPVLAPTATAGGDVAADIMKLLGIPRSGLVDTGAYRPNLHFAVEQSPDEHERLRRSACSKRCRHTANPSRSTTASSAHASATTPRKPSWQVEFAPRSPRMPSAWASTRPTSVHGRPQICQAFS